MSPEALAARLPNDCRSFDGYDTPAGFQATAARVAAWLDTQAPGTAETLTIPVMTAAGVGPTDWYRPALGTQSDRNSPG
ncbi:hypothetical protein [Mycolicibacterium aurum]|nr:hypothetical protein [Mycolicibacterium aurum]